MRRRAVVTTIGLALMLALLGGCGGEDEGGGGGGTVAAEKAADAEVINVAVSQELTLVEGLHLAEPYLRRPESRALFRQFAAQEREHVDGWTKAMRGIGGELEAEPEELDLSEVKTERDALLFVHDLVSLQLTHFLDDVTHLRMPAPQSFAASVAASQAQHLVVLRQLLGADLAESVPEAFDTGEVPAPEPRESPVDKE